jgi:hypothetical protein
MRRQRNESDELDIIELVWIVIADARAHYFLKEALICLHSFTNHNGGWVTVNHREALPNILWRDCNNHF